MSQLSDMCIILKDNLKKYPNNYKIVIDVFTAVIDDEGWEDSDVIRMLHHSFGISNEIDIELQRRIDEMKSLPFSSFKKV